MTRASEALTFLRSLWGILAVTAVAFPGAAAILKVPIAPARSTIGVLYPIVGVIVAAFALLLATAYRDRFVSLAVARRWAVTSMIVGLVSFFSFTATRVVLLDVVEAREYISADGKQRISRERGGGLVQEMTKPLDGNIRDFPETQSKRGDPLDILALALFAGTFAAIAVAFSALGLHVYEMEAMHDARDQKR